MSEFPTSGVPKGRLPVWVPAVGVLALLILAISCGGFVYWLLFRQNTAPVSSQALATQPVSSHPPSSQSPSRQPLPNLPLPSDLSSSATAGFLELFNGQDLAGWDFDPEVWSVRDGVIFGQQQRNGPGRALFWNDSEVADFDLRFRFRLEAGNCGVNYRSTRLADFDVGGYEFEIFTNKTGNLANVGTDRERYRLHQAPKNAPPTDAEWHEAVIIAKGGRLVHILDGKTLCDVEDNNPAAPLSGVIAFNIGPGAVIEFKDIRLKRLEPGK